ncbi:alginate O-acetyltransferase [Pasteurellaceae bacterium Macca]|nr:alginate O-acetyltransferase [Pasteurellaceae bacterium Macca]
MPLLSVEFLLFFLLFFPLYWAFKSFPKFQNFLLLLASITWLASISLWMVAVILIFSTIIYFVGNKINHTSSILGKKVWLNVGILLVIGHLSFFKFFDFFRPALQEVFNGDVIDILMPLGLSYYSFQAISYLVSLYRNENAYLKWNNLLLHFSFFPTITSGPIFRANYNGKDAPIGATQQINIKTRQIIAPALAISLILLGIAKKWWLASLLADDFVNPIFESPAQYHGLDILTSIYGYTFQLFLDFSGYTELVIGLAMLLGFQLPKNFNAPLLAYNIRDFWGKWHISLSTWIRDYIYIPLGGSRVGFFRTQLNLLIAMTLSGIWHGSGINFLLWGALHGIALVLLNIGDKIFGKRNVFSHSSYTGYFLSVLITFHFVCVTFVIFRTSSLQEVELIFSSLYQNMTMTQFELKPILTLAIFSLIMIFYPLMRKGFNLFVTVLEKLPIILWVIPLVISFIIIYIFAPSGIPGFIYANF